MSTTAAMKIGSGARAQFIDDLKAGKAYFFPAVIGDAIGLDEDYAFFKALLGRGSSSPNKAMVNQLCALRAVMQLRVAKK